MPLGSRVAFDARLAGVAVLGAIVLGMALALPIVWYQCRTDPRHAIQSEGRGGTSSRAAQRLRHGFIVAQIALALVLLAVAGLFGTSLARAMAISPGFRGDHVLTAQMTLPWSRYGDSAVRVAFHERLLREIARQPGVAAAGVISNVPFSGDNGKSAVTIKGHIRLPSESPRGHYAYGVDGDYFKAMGYSLLEGRFLTAEDSLRSSRVCVVDEDLARYYWPHASAIGQRVYDGSEQTTDAESFVVVGVVNTVKQAGLTEQTAQGAIYFPYALRTSDSVFLVVRTSGRPEAMAPALAKLVRREDPTLPVSDLRSMDTRIADSLVAQRSPAVIAGFFSLVALLLVSVGTYGVFGYALVHRRREIGVRMALGARPRQIHGQFLTLALQLLAAGELTGTLGAWLTSRAMRTVLFQTPDFPVAVFACAAGVIAVVSLCACFLVSRRASRISPTETLAEQ